MHRSSNFAFLVYKKNDKRDIFTFLSDKNEQCISVQIWDIESLKIKKGDEIIGTELSDRYELELAAILSCYNEHFSSNELWKKQSANQVHQSALSRTDVLNDHQVLLSERVCLEISQVDYPEFRQISASRLFILGYDSTSIFLWGYLIMLSAGYEICDLKTDKLHLEMLKLSSEPNINYEELKKITIQKQYISKEIEQYNDLEKISIEERHKEYIKKGIKIRGLLDIRNHMDIVFNKMQELSEIILSTDSTIISNEINTLLKEVRAMNENQSEASKRLSLLSVILAFSAVFPLINFLVQVFPRFNNQIGLIRLFSFSLALLIFISYFVLKKK